MSKVLIVDDKEMMRDSVGAMLTRAGSDVLVADSGKAALNLLLERNPDVVLTDLQMPGMGGVELLREIRKSDEEIPVIVMTAFGTVQSAVEAMKEGAFDYVTKPLDPDQLVMTVKRALERAALVRENEVLKSQLNHGRRSSGAQHGPALIGEAPSMRELKQQISRIAQSQGTVLITGESGVGKEVVAQCIHRLSARSASPILAVNCAALSPALLESELFGHERGAFTGADKVRKGRFELADGGSLLLDEISEIPTSVQAKLLRVLQERTFERVGSSVSRQTDTRILATTNRDLEHEVGQGGFRQDLFFRLNVLPIRVPSLRERVEDIPLLCRHFLTLVAQREGRGPQRFSSEAMEILQGYSWPGNVRELVNVCERACIFTPGGEIVADTIAPWLSNVAPVPALPKVTIPSLKRSIEPSPYLESNEDIPSIWVKPRENGMGPLRTNGASSLQTLDAPDETAGILDVATHEPIQAHGRALEDIERDVIVAALKRNDGHRQRTATELKIGLRTLGLKLKKWKDLNLVSQDL